MTTMGDTFLSLKSLEETRAESHTCGAPIAYAALVRRVQYAREVLESMAAHTTCQI